MISALMTVFNEVDFIDYAIRACLPYVDHLVIVEGAYQETIKLGVSPRSTDGTLEIIEKYKSEPKVHILYENQESDKDQRNAGLDYIKQLNPDGWLILIDGDEVWDKDSLQMVKAAANNMERSKKMAAYFKSLTFVNGFDSYTEQEFPRLFKITSGAKFVNDNFMVWEDKKLSWSYPHVFKIPYVRYHHYSFCKGKRFLLKKDWWESRFGDNYGGSGKKFEYDWYLNEDGKIYSPNHEILEYTGQHPEVMKSHPKMLIKIEKNNGPEWIQMGHGAGYWKAENET